MRHVAVVAAVTALTLTATGCSDAGDERPTTASTVNPDAPRHSAQRFDQPFPVAGETWDATVTVSGLRIVPSSAYADRVLAIDVRAVQAAGEPVIAPSDFTALDPSGEELERIENPAGLLPDPLVETVMTSPGQEIRGQVAWTVPDGIRVGRVEMVAPRTISSILVTRQPDAPDATGAAAPGQPAT